MIWKYNIRLLLGIFLFLLFCSVFFVLLLMNSTKVPFYQDEVSKDVFELERWEDLEKMLGVKLKQDRDEREREWKSDFLLPITDSAIPALAAVAAFPPPVAPSTSCSPPPLPSSPSCKDPAFTGTVLPKPRRIVLMLLFGFEVFNPLLSSVDKPGGHSGGDAEGGARLGGEDLPCGEHRHSQGSLQTTSLGEAEVRKEFKYKMKNES